MFGTLFVVRTASNDFLMPCFVLFPSLNSGVDVKLVRPSEAYYCIYDNSSRKQNVNHMKNTDVDAHYIQTVNFFQCIWGWGDAGWKESRLSYLIDCFFDWLISVELGSCQTGWKAFGQNCYQVNSNKKSWIQARLACANQRADLVSIHSPVEQAHIALQVGPYGLNAEAWIGNFAIAVAYFLLTAIFVFFKPRNM